MTIHRLSCGCALAAVLAGNSLCVAGPVTMTLLRDGVVGLSDDGSVVAFQRTQPHPSSTWTASGGYVPIPIPQGFTSANVAGISRDGRYVAGTAVFNTTQSAYRYTRSSNTSLALGDVPGGSNRSAGEAVSSNGVIVGTVRDDLGAHAAVWREGSGWQVLDTNPNYRFFEATAVNIDASVVGGHGGSPSLIAGHWTEAAGPLPLPTLSSSTFSSVRAMSADGRTILGIDNSDTLIWRDGQVQQLNIERLVTYEFSLRADGRMAGVATATGAYLWEEGVGARPLSEVVASLGFTVNGFRFDSIHGISADGSIMTGIGRTSTGTRVSYLLTNVPAPGTCLAFLALPLMTTRRRTRA